MTIDGYYFSVPHYEIFSCHLYEMLKAEKLGISLVVQWLRICLPMQGTWVQSLVQELRSTCHRATKPQLLNLSILEPVFCNKRGYCNEKPANSN